MKQSTLCSCLIYQAALLCPINPAHLRWAWVNPALFAKGLDKLGNYFTTLL